MTTLCDVIDNCIECPRYGDDCDGDKKTEHTDLISRADAIGAVCDVVIDEFDVSPTLGYDVAEKALSALPSADADWIPVSERLPSEDGDYLVCKSWEYHGMDVLQWVDGWNCYRGYDGKINRESEIDGADILAWMPLPKPYREDGEEE